MAAEKGSADRRLRPPPVPKTALALSVMLGLAALALALGRLPAEWALLWAPPPLSDRPAPDGLADTLGETAATTGAARAAAVAARLRLERLPAGAEREEILIAAIADMRRALSGAPLDAETWERLAFAEYARHRFLEAARAWRMSVVAQPFDPATTPRRLESGFALWPFMDADARDVMDRQVQVFYGWGPTTLAEMTARFGAAAIVRRALAADPVAVADFERRLAAVKP